MHRQDKKAKDFHLLFAWAGCRRSTYMMQDEELKMTAVTRTEGGARADRWVGLVKQ